MAEKREFSPMKATHPDPNRIQCKDCVNRDRTMVKLPSGKVIPSGITKDFCVVYSIQDNGKPYEVLFQNAECRYYVKEYGNGDNS